MTPLESLDFDGPAAPTERTAMFNASPELNETPVSVEPSTTETVFGQCVEVANTLCKLPQHESSIPLSGNLAPVNLTAEGEVDSALLSAMRDPRERVALLKLEQSMVEFMRNTELKTISVGGLYNSAVVGLKTNQAIQDIGRTTSFQRCWLHRLCDRFHISRESVDMDWIALVKTEQSSIPRALLIDLDPSQYALEEQMSNLTVNKPGKMKIMKRSGSSFGSNGSLMDNSDRKKSGRKNQTEKEKAYAEARARIFNELNTDEEGTPTESEATLASSTSKEDEIPTSSNGHESTSQHAERSRAGKKGGVSKVTWRNRQQEEADPDFQRQQSVPYYATGYPYQQQHHQPPQYYGQYDQQYFVEQPFFPSEGYNDVRTNASISGRGRGRASLRSGRAKQTNVNSMDDFPALR